MKMLGMILSLVVFQSYANTLSGKVSIDGSSTVEPITTAIAEEFRNVQPNVRVNIGVSGTGGGFKQFTKGDIDINNASRHIKKEEQEIAKKNNIEFLEIPVAFDGLSVVVNKKNTWAKTLTVAELKKIWEPNSKVVNWSDIRAEWPNRPIKLYGPGTDSGTFDYFTEAINGKSGSSRSNFVKSEDDNILVTGVAGDLDSLGYFGFAFYKENQTKITAVAIDNGSGAILPSEETINNGTYAPLSRPVFVYVSKKAVQRPEVKEFLTFYLKTVNSIVGDVGYVALPKKKFDEVFSQFNSFAK